MKKIKYSLFTLLLCIAQFAIGQSENSEFLVASNNFNVETSSQDQSTDKSAAPAAAAAPDTTKTKWNVNFDVSLTSRFIWRGLELGEYPSIQPNVTLSKGKFFTGIWASHSLAPAETSEGNITGYKEVIPYVGYGFDIGKTNLTVLFLGHYNPNFGDFLDFDSDRKTNRGEIRTLFNAGKFDFFGAIDVINDPSDNTSIYLEVGYTFDMPNDVKVRPLVSFTPSDNYYTTDGKANFTQIGFTTSKAVKITDKFTLPVKIDLSYNPDRKDLYSSFTVTAKF